MSALRQRRTTLPLGIDVGSARIRVALSERDRNGKPMLTAVATRPAGGDLAAVLADAVRELATRERRCVFGVGEPAAILRIASFPAMTRSERERAARFEATRFIAYPLAEALVRVMPLDAAGESVIGVVRKALVADVIAAAKRAQLRTVGIDNNAFALQRVMPDSDAILDIGRSGSVLHLYGRRLPIAHHFATGGRAFTEAIAHAFGADEETAERRKHAHGIAGAGEYVRDLLVENVASALIEFRASGSGDIRNLALVGNGARLDDLPLALERATAIPVHVGVFAPHVSDTLPPDVLRAAAPDWCQAYGLTLWTAA